MAGRRRGGPAAVRPESLAHLVHAMHVSGDLRRVSANDADAIAYALRQVGHLRQPSPEAVFADFRPEWLAHLVHALHVSGDLGRLSVNDAAAIAHALRQSQHLRAVNAQSRKTIDMNIDVVGMCNLRCPSCPVGNTGAINPSGLMKVELFERIILKAKREYPLENVYLFNWTEPLLHPELPALISFVRRQGLPCGVSSNLNNLKNIEQVIAARPTAFRISLSGFTQEAYGQTHAAGNIERVKRNMAILSETIRRQGAHEIGVHVYFHKYRHNLHEAAPMRRYAEALGFGWQEDWAYLMGMEKVLDHVAGHLPEDQREFTERQFALPIREAAEAARLYRDMPCAILPDLTIDVQGYLALCCATYDSKANRLGFFLDMTPEDVQRAKTGHPLCGPCSEQGVHVYVRYDQHPVLRHVYDYLALANTSAPETAPRRVSLPLVA